MRHRRRPQDCWCGPFRGQMQHLPPCIPQTASADPRASPRHSTLRHCQMNAHCPIPNSRDQLGPAGTGLWDGADTQLDARTQAHRSSLEMHIGAQGASAGMRATEAHWGRPSLRACPNHQKGPSPSACTAAARFTRWSASSMASAGPSGSSRDSPMTRMRISVSSRMGTSEQRRRKKLWAKQVGLAWEGAANAPLPHAGEAPAPSLDGAGRGHHPAPEASMDKAWPRQGRRQEGAQPPGAQMNQPPATATHSTAQGGAGSLTSWTRQQRPKGKDGREPLKNTWEMGPRHQPREEGRVHMAAWRPRGNSEFEGPVDMGQLKPWEWTALRRHGRCSTGGWGRGQGWRSGKTDRGSPGVHSAHGSRAPPHHPCTHGGYAHLRSLSGGQLSHL